MRRLKGVEFNRRVLSDVALDNVSFENCTFSDSWIRRGSLRDIGLSDSSLWACGLEDVTVERCVVDGATAGRHARSGRRMPIMLWGVLVSRVVLKGKIDSFIWNPSRASRSSGDAPWTAAFQFYQSVDWALDITDARFLSVPSLRFGPPGRLVRRDVETQPLITREAVAKGAWRDLGSAIGIWRTVLANFLEAEWPDDIVLIPAGGGPKKEYERQLAGIASLREAGIASA